MTEKNRPRPNLHMAIIVMLVASFAMVASAPLLMIDSYSWIANTISESGAQGVDGAWLFRIGVLMAAAATTTMVATAGDGLPASSKRALALYALSLVAAAAFPEKPWLDGPYNEMIAGLHTVAAFNTGLWFGIGVFAASRHRSSTTVVTYDVVMVVMVATIPILMLVFDSFEGLFQRILIVAGYVWLFLEASRITEENRHRLLVG